MFVVFMFPSSPDTTVQDMNYTVVVEGGVGRRNEEVADLEGLVGEVRGLPDGEAGWVAVPVVVGLGDVADVVDLLAWVIVVDVFGLAVHCALEVVAAVFDTPEPDRLSTC